MKRTSYLITTNNPQKHYDFCKWFNADTCSEQDCIKLCKSFNNYYFNYSKTRKPSLTTNGIMTVCERGEEGTLHLHTIICSKARVELTRLQEIFNHSNIIPTYADHFEQVEDYFYKDTEKHKHKANTTLCKPQKMGEFFIVDKEQIKYNWSWVDEEIKKGTTPDELSIKSSWASAHKEAIKIHYFDYHKALIPDSIPVFCEYHFGPSYCGKTTYIRNELKKKNLLKNRLLCTGGNKNIFDKYNFLIHKVIQFEDLKKGDIGPDGISPSLILNILNEDTDLQLPARYQNIDKKCFEYAYFSSIYPPELIFPTRDQFETDRQLLNRIDKIFYHYIDPSFNCDDPNRYKFYVLNDTKDYIDFNNFIKKVKSDLNADITPDGILVK